MGYGGATWATAGTLTLGANTFDVADSTEDGPVIYDQAWWKLTPAALTRITLTAAENGFLRVYTGDEADPVEIVATSGDPAAGTFDAHPDVEYHVLLGRGALDDPKVTYVLTWTEVALTTSPWIDDLQDNPDNHLIVTDGDLRLDNPNPDYAGSPIVRPDWMNDVMRGISGRRGTFRVQENLPQDPDVLGGTSCAVAHAEIGSTATIVWDGICPPLPIGEEADLGSISADSTEWRLEYSDTAGGVAGHVEADASGPGYALWYLAVRDSLPEKGALDVDPDPTAYGYPADAVLEWEEPVVRLLRIDIADGDPTDTADHSNLWALNSVRAPLWVGEDNYLPWDCGDITTSGGTDPARPGLTFSYDAGDVEWNEIPGTTGWDEDWAADWAELVPATSDSTVVAWPTSVPSGYVTLERFARPALRFVLEAPRFRFIYEGIPETPPRRGWPSNRGFTAPASGWGRRASIQNGPRGWGAVT